LGPRVWRCLIASVLSLCLSACSRGVLDPLGPVGADDASILFDVVMLAIVIEVDPFRPLPSKTAPLEVEVVSLDWTWLFIYPEQTSQPSTRW
jgi:heme/copper-type cytochrome/quinol oxidase subunit 2